MSEELTFTMEQTQAAILAAIATIGEAVREVVETPDDAFELADPAFALHRVATIVEDAWRGATDTLAREWRVAPPAEG